MADTMVYKNFNISQKQDLLLKQVAKQRGVSQAAVIRQALDREFGLIALESRAAFGKMEAFMEDRKTKYSGQGEPYRWNRDEIYEERENSLVDHAKIK